MLGTFLFIYLFFHHIINVNSIQIRFFSPTPPIVEIEIGFTLNVNFLNKDNIF